MALVVLIKGANVGGHRTFRPSALVRELTRFDLVNVGAAGTFVVRGSVNRTKLRAEIMRRLPFQADIIMCRGSDILDLAARDPFSGQPSRRDIVQFVSVLAKAGQPLPSVPLDLPSGGAW